ncbi:MAG: hypothetical protein KDK62_05010 [Chlamydiia bacterium]|nr:hypothetical protein [Chlamydiia bacterium]
MDKLIKKILAGSSVSYQEAETILFLLDFELRICGSHHVFGKKNYPKNVSLKIRKELLPYQVKMLQEVLKSHGY